jgi:hypothetical protein
MSSAAGGFTEMEQRTTAALAEVNESAKSESRSAP